jgi:hypothetical protein
LRFLIWSIEHQAWWGPARRGYTEDPHAAGRYSYQEAHDILAEANVVTIHECLIPERMVMAS